jgi:hypothetical protein
LLRQVLAQPNARLLALDLTSEHQPGAKSSQELGSIRRFRETSGSGH